MNKWLRNQRINFTDLCVALLGFLRKSVSVFFPDLLSARTCFSLLLRLHFLCYIRCRPFFLFSEFNFYFIKYFFNVPSAFIKKRNQAWRYCFVQACYKTIHITGYRAFINYSMHHYSSRTPDNLILQNSTVFLATGHVLRPGKRVAVTRTEFVNDEGILIAAGTSSYIMG